MTHFLAFVSILCVSLYAPLLQEEVLVEGQSKQALFDASFQYIASLPQYGAFKPEMPKTDIYSGTIEADRSFIIYEQKGILSHAIAEVAYTVSVHASDGKIFYQFSEPKVYPYKRNRYGRYEKSSTKPLDSETLSKGEWKKVAPRWIAHIQGYATHLKGALPAPIEPVVQH